jgi:hypothetical protein
VIEPRPINLFQNAMEGRADQFLYSNLKSNLYNTAQYLHSTSTPTCTHNTVCRIIRLLCFFPNIIISNRIKSYVCTTIPHCSCGKKEKLYDDEFIFLFVRFRFCHFPFFCALSWFGWVDVFVYGNDRNVYTYTHRNLFPFE